jgi:hypothetical protein
VCAMIANLDAAAWWALRRVSACGVVLLLLGGCGGEDSGLSPSDVPVIAADPADSIGVVDSTVAPTDSTIPIDSAVLIDTTGISTLTGTAPGIVFGTIQIPTSLINSVQTGTLVGGEIDPVNVLTYLSATRAKGGRIVIKLCRGRDDFVKNPDGTFSFTKWKALIDRYRTVNLAPYINDGTILGHYLIDEPHRTARWGGKIIPQATLEAMAKYSKQIWPGMTTFVRVAPSWLAGVSTTYTYLDAGWLQYESWMGSVSTKLASEVAAAKRKGLGLAVGLNVLDGGNGSSKVAGWTRSKYKMSASEIRTYGTALLSQTYSCGFYNWMWDSPYYGRTDIKTVMAELSSKARNHIKTSCKQ